MCDQQSLRPACAYAQSDQSLCLSLEYSMIVKLLTEHHLEFLSLTGGCTGSSESTLIKMPHCWKSHALAQINRSGKEGFWIYKQNNHKITVLRFLKKPIGKWSLILMLPNVTLCDWLGIRHINKSFMTTHYISKPWKTFSPQTILA